MSNHGSKRRKRAGTTQRMMEVASLPAELRNLTAAQIRAMAANYLAGQPVVIPSDLSNQDGSYSTQNVTSPASSASETQNLAFTSSEFRPTVIPSISVIISKCTDKSYHEKIRAERKGWDDMRFDLVGSLLKTMTITEKICSIESCSLDASHQCISCVTRDPLCHAHATLHFKTKQCCVVDPTESHLNKEEQTSSILLVTRDTWHYSERLTVNEMLSRHFFPGSPQQPQVGFHNNKICLNNNKLLFNNNYFTVRLL